MHICTLSLRIIKLLSVILFLSSPVVAQWLPAVEVEVKLTDGEVYTAALDPIAVDQAGLLWLSRFNVGVGRYDGEAMTVYDEEDGITCQVQYMAQDGQGYIWLGGQPLGANTTTLVRSTLPFLGGEEPAGVKFTDSLPGHALIDGGIGCLKTDANGRVWAGAEGMVVRYGYSSSGALQVDTILTTSIPDKTGGVGFGKSGELYLLQQDTMLYVSTINHQVGDAFTPYRLEGVAGDASEIKIGPDGNLWLNSGSRLARYAKPLAGQTISLLEGLGMNRRVTGISSMIFPNEKTALLSLPTGLVEIDIATMSVRQEYDHAQALNIPALQTILDDDQGNIWVGTVTGLARMPSDFLAYASPNNWTMGPEAEIPDNAVVQVARMGGPDGSWLLIGTSTGIYVRSEKGEWQVVGKEQGLLLPNVLGMASDENGRIWAASTAAGINLLSPSEFLHPRSVRPTALSIHGSDYVISGVPSTYMYSPFVLPLPREGDQPASLTLWGGNLDIGQSLADEFPWLWFYDDAGYHGGPIAFYAQDEHGRILASSQNSTLLRTVEPFTYEYYAQLHENVTVKREGLYYRSKDSTVFESIQLKWDTTTFPVVLGMAAIEDELWLGVETGALVLDLETLEAKAFIPMSCPDCEPKDFVHDPQRNRIWAASSSGIWEIDARNYTLVRMITEENGLRGNTGFSPQCITLDAAGTIYYATSQGLAAYQPELAQPVADSFAVYVRKRQFQEDNWGKNEVTLRYAALDFREAKRLYQTKLEGYDEEWSESTKNASLRYTNLPAYIFSRTYKFRVRSAQGDGAWIESAAATEITVSPPWYFRWWAVLIGLGLLALVIRWFVRFQLRQQADALALKEAAVIKEQRDEISRKNDQNELLLKEIHHRVKNNLEVVSSLLELQSAGLSDSEARDAMQAGQSRVQSMGLLHQKLYQGENLAAIEMKDYFQNLAGSLLETYEAEGRIKVNITMDPLELDVDTAVPLGLIVNELLTNTIKYAFEGAAAGAVEVGMSKEGSGYLLRVKDNGTGKDFDAPAAGSGFGTRLVSLLSRQLGGTLTEVNDGGLKTELRFDQRP